MQQSTRPDPAPQPTRRTRRRLRDCTCATCVSACTQTPGWWAPGEAQEAAAFLGVPWPEFRDLYVIEDYWVGGAVVYAPRKRGVEEHNRRASWSYAWQYAPCVFLETNRCRIHAVKPWECRHSMPCGKVSGGLRAVINRMWLAVGDPLGRCDHAPEEE